MILIINFELYILIFRHCSKVAGPGPAGITFFGVVKLFFLPTITAIGIGVGYIVALVYVAPSITSAVFSATVAISYVLSILVLKHPHLIIKVKYRTFIIYSPCIIYIVQSYRTVNYILYQLYLITIIMGFSIIVDSFRAVLFRRSRFGCLRDNTGSPRVRRVHWHNCHFDLNYLPCTSFGIINLSNSFACFEISKRTVRYRSVKI